jgi:hypothetical protein
VSFSIPLVAETMGTGRSSSGATRDITLRTTWLGITLSRRSRPSIVSRRSFVARTFFGSVTSGR